MHPWENFECVLKHTVLRTSTYRNNIVSDERQSADIQHAYFARKFGKVLKVLIDHNIPIEQYAYYL